MPLKERKRLTIQQRVAAFVAKEIIPSSRIKVKKLRMNVRMLEEEDVYDVHLLLI